MGDNLERRFNDLMVAYTTACGTPEDSANFMPHLWERIEARRRQVFPIRQWAQRFITAGAAICLVLGLVLITPIPQNNSTISLASYLEALADENDMIASSDVHVDSEGESQGYVGNPGYVE